MMRIAVVLVMATVAAGVLGACSGPAEEPSPAAPGAMAQEEKQAPAVEQAGLPAEAIAANNRGVGLMGRFEYAPAAEVFTDLAEKYPDWLDVQVNLAIAILNRQNEGDEQLALGMAEDVLRQDPGNLRAHYVAGLLKLYLSSPDAALPHFRAVEDADPEDAYAAYYLAQCLAQEQQHEAALPWFRRAMELDPYLRSAYYGAFQALQRLQRRDEARSLIQDYQRLAPNPRAHLAEFKYTRMGPKGEALAVGSEVEKAPVRPEGPLFAAATPLNLETPLPGLEARAGSAPLSLTVADLQGDGMPDLFVAGAGPGAGTENLLLVATPDGGYRLEPDHPLARVSDVRAALWGDYDNDGRVDVYLCRQGPNQLWRQDEHVQWTDVTEAAGVSGSDLDTVDGAFFDADHDGDLDLFLVNADGPDELFSNNLDGSFRPLAQSQGLAGGDRASRAVVPVDLDRDRDLDILVIHRDPPHALYLNDRMWAYREIRGGDFGELLTTPALSALAADRDADGWPELYTTTPKGRLLKWRRGDDGKLAPEDLGELGSTGAAWAALGALDADGDGVEEILEAGPRGWSVRDETRVLFRGEASADAKLLGLAPLLAGPGRGPEILALVQGQGLRLWGPGPGRLDYLALTLSGREDQAESMRSNASGIGARLALRVDSRWTLADTLRRYTGPGQSLQPLALGLGGAQKADFLTVEWPDGVLQSELDLKAGELHVITETQRQLSSCPVLFSWDGREYRFVTDLLGVGGIGYMVGPGEYAPPRPWENLLLPEGVAQPRDGHYLLKLSEPMEEALYLDGARLRAYDLPPGWQMVLDERMGVAEPEPTGGPLWYRDERLPNRVVNDRGQEVTEHLRRADGDAAPVGPIDHRFIGRLADEHVLVLEFDEALDREPGEPILIADGWVEYPYSQTSFAAWQAGAEYAAPTLEARGADGRWQPVRQGFGYPAGMPRRMSLPLGRLPEGTRALRLRTNMEIYWDRLAVAYAEPQPQVRVTLLPLVQARVAKTGFAQRSTFDQRRPAYEYARRKPFWDARYLDGLYTNLGPATELVSAVDDALAIIGSGEEVHLELSAKGLPELQPGWTRRLVLEAHGWAKDMDLFTRDGATLEPLPSRGLDATRAAELHARYNQRHLSGY